MPIVDTLQRSIDRKQFIAHNVVERGDDIIVTTFDRLFRRIRADWPVSVLKMAVESFMASQQFRAQRP